jgi:spermidine synthase
MLSAFILGLALGSFHVRNRIERYANPIRALAWVQLVMGALALGTLVLYGQSFDWMGFVLASVQRNEGGYALFNVASNAICLALMLPVTFFAGMTLPLITAILLKGGSGEAGIGRVYAANTVGAIVGVLLAVHLVMPLLGLKQVIVAGAAVDIGLGLALLMRTRAPLATGERAGLAVLGCAVVAIAAFADLEPARLASSVFRLGTARSPNEVVFHRDGKTSSVDVTRNPKTGALALLTNGKVDSSQLKAGASQDDYTMVLSAALPMLLHPGAREIAVVGMGSGRTTHAFLHARGVERVDTVEIEQGVVEAAHLFGEPVARAFTDPRSRIHIEDAKTFFARNAQRYDIIMSEPSNPWVSGVASLFSQEFYGQVRRYLKQRGLFVQWLQLYEFDLTLLASVLEALGGAFDDYAIYATNMGDILIVASPDGSVAAMREGAIGASGLEDLLAAVDVRTAADIGVRRIGNKAELTAFIASLHAPANSDYHPYVDQNAVRRRFMRTDATAFGDLGPVNRRLAPRALPSSPATPSVLYAPQERAAQARVIGQYFAWQAERGEAPRGTVQNRLLELVVTLRALHSQCDGLTLQATWVPAMRRFTEAMITDLEPRAVADIVADLRSARCFGGAPEEVRDWIAFFEAAGLRRDAEVMRRGEALARRSRADGEDVPEIVAQELLVAELRSGAGRVARPADAELGFPDSVALRYLRARLRPGGATGRPGAATPSAP